MSTERYITPDENLYFFCRLDRYTPMTARFISWGADVTTPLTQKELSAVMREDFVSDHETINRQLHRLGCNTAIKAYSDGPHYEHYKASDHNHSGFWDNAFVHTLGRTATFWNLDGDSEAILDEAFTINPQVGAEFIHSYLFDLIEDDTKFTELQSAHADLVFMQWFDERRAELPEGPDPNNYDPNVASQYYDALDTVIFDALTKTTEFNDDIKTLLAEGTSAENDPEGRLRDKIIRTILREIFPLNQKADGYILNGYRTMVPADAMRDAIYVGNITEVLELLSSGATLLPDDQPVIRPSDITGKNYPSEMKRGMQSDWLTGGPYPELEFQPKTEYPQMGRIDILDTGYDFENEQNAVTQVPDSDQWWAFIQKRTRQEAPEPEV